MNRVLRSALVALALVAAPVAVQAQTTLGPTLAFHDDADFGIGLSVGFPIEALHEQIGFLGDFTYFFPDGDLNYWEINGNLTYDFPLEDASAVPFVLAGLNIARFSADIAPGVSFSDTEVGLNIGGGVKFDVGSMRPTVGVRLELEGGEGFVIFGTLPFVVGG